MCIGLPHLVLVKWLAAMASSMFGVYIFDFPGLEGPISDPEINFIYVCFWMAHNDDMMSDVPPLSTTSMGFWGN